MGLARIRGRAMELDVKPNQARRYQIVLDRAPDDTVMGRSQQVTLLARLKDTILPNQGGWPRPKMQSTGVRIAVIPTTSKNALSLKRRRFA